MKHIPTHAAPKPSRQAPLRRSISFAVLLAFIPLVLAASPASAQQQAPVVVTQPATAFRSVTLASPKAPYPFRGWAGPWRNPHPSSWVSSCFGWRWGAMHRGVDLVRGYGTAIRVAATGRVMAFDRSGNGYGIGVIVYHGGGVWTHYGHMSRRVVKVGQNVNAGTIIGYEGNTGDVRPRPTSSNPTAGSHLHFEVEHGNRTKYFNYRTQVEPTAFLADRGVRIGGC